MHDDENYRYIGKNNIIDLSISENHILKKLIENKGKVVKYEVLALKKYNKDFYSPCYGVTRIVYRLRQKLAGEVEIKTKNQIGYYI